MYTHKVGFIKLFDNNCSRSHVVTFESESPLYSEAVLSLVNKRKEYHNMLAFEPVTRSPITFDYTIKWDADSGNTFNSDRWFLVFSDMLEEIGKEVEKPRMHSIVKQPFCRVLFSKAGKLAEFLDNHHDSYTKSEKPFLAPSNIFHNKGFESYDAMIFNQIKNGVYPHEYA